MWPLFFTVAILIAVFAVVDAVASNLHYERLLAEREQKMNRRR